MRTEFLQPLLLLLLLLYVLDVLFVLLGGLSLEVAIILFGLLQPVLNLEVALVGPLHSFLGELFSVRRALHVLFAFLFREHQPRILLSLQLFEAPFLVYELSVHYGGTTLCGRVVKARLAGWELGRALLAQCIVVERLNLPHKRRVLEDFAN